MQKKPVVAAVITDIVASKRIADREASYADLVDSFRHINRLTSPLSAWTPTVGDEAQAVYSSPLDAIRATLIFRLVLPAHIDCRFGIGVGHQDTIGRRGEQIVQDGPAWWGARQAILEGQAREGRRNPNLRTWYQILEPELKPNNPQVDLTNAYLICRDQIIGDMSLRGRTLLLEQILGRSQSESAKAQNISQAAVSQRLKKDGAYAIMASLKLLEEAL